MDGQSGHPLEIAEILRQYRHTMSQRGCSNQQIIGANRLPADKHERPNASMHSSYQQVERQDWNNSERRFDERRPLLPTSY